MADQLLPDKLKSKSAQHCAVPFCTSDSRYNPELHFNHFPKNPELKKQWIIKIRRDEGSQFRISNSTVVCSNHFKPEDYTGWSPNRKRLKTDSEFNWTSTKVACRQLKRKAPVLPEKATPEDNDDEDTSINDGTLGEFEDSSLVAENTMGESSRIDILQRQLEQKENKIEKLQEQLRLEKFGVTRFSNDDSLINFYTGFPTYSEFITFFKCIEPTAQNMNSVYYQSSDTISLAGRKRGMLLVDELFLFLCPLHMGLLEQDLSVRFNCSLQTVSRKLITWANFLYFILGSIPIWLSKQQINDLMPDCFKVTYPNTRVIIDCTEIKTQQPSSLVLNSQMFSTYKGANTFKCLLGIAPHGAVTFISPLYQLSVSLRLKLGYT